MEVSLNEVETRYYRDLFACCDVEKTGKIPMLKATELFRSAEKSCDEKILSEITTIAGIPATALYISRAQFFSCLKLIAAYQSEIKPLRKELIVASNVQLPLPRFSWNHHQHQTAINAIDSAPQINGSLNSGAVAALSMPPPPLPPTNTERRSSLTHEGSRRNSNVQQQDQAALNSDIQSTDSEVEQNESSCGGGGGGIAESGGAGSSGREMHRRHRTGSPEAWSTNSDSPTPTNSVAERKWAKEKFWQDLLGDEHRQLLGTEEESSDRHSSDDEETDLETVYQITPEQRDYYYKQFKHVQHDPHGLLSGQVAKDFFEKSRIPVEELRHIWQLCDVTRDGALSLSEFTAAMHLVVLRRNNIPLPTTLPACLHPNVLQHSTMTAMTTSTTAIGAAATNVQPQEPPEADLLHLNDDDDEENTENTIINGAVGTAVAAANASGAATTNASAVTSQLTSTTNTVINNEKNVMNLSTLSTSSQDAQATQWTKFTESPTSNVSSPGPKPVNFDMQRTAQAVVSDPQILHPVPVRVTPVGDFNVIKGVSSNTAIVAGAGAATATVPAAASNATATNAATEVQPLDIGDGLQQQQQPLNFRSFSPKQYLPTTATSANANINASSASSASATALTTTTHHRDLLAQQSNDLRAIQRPQPKKLPNKSVGAIPPPPQREPSIGSSSSGGGGGGGDGGVLVISSTDTDSTSSNNSQHQQMSAKKDIPPPLPPPRPHRHGRSNSLDLNKFKIGSNGSGQQAENDENAEQQHSLPPQQQHQFENQLQQQQAPPQLPPTAASTTAAAVAATALPFSRISLQSNQRVSAFEVYRKPNTPRNSQSPPQPAAIVTTNVGNQHLAHAAPFGAAGAAAIAGGTLAPLPNADVYEKRVNAITETLRHVSFKADSNMTDILRHLREQNGLLLHLCNDLSDELLTVQTRKEELRQKLEAANESIMGAGAAGIIGLAAPPRTASSISAPVTANVTGGSGSSGVHSNV